MVDYANYWAELDSDDRSSTVGYFQTGAVCTTTTEDAEKDEEVLVWKGEENDVEGTVYIESHFSGTDSVPDDAKFVVECVDADGGLVNEYFESSLEEAIKTAQMLTEGSLPRNPNK